MTPPRKTVKKKKKTSKKCNDLPHIKFKHVFRVDFKGK